MKTKNLIIIDNYDSFTYNIVQYLRELNVNPQVYKNDEITAQELKKMDEIQTITEIIISPGPGNPDNAGISLEVIKHFHKTTKILGVCLGHQAIAQFFGGKIIKAKEPVHGKVSKIYFEQNAIFDGFEQGFEATRYHSLIVDDATMPDCLQTIARASTAHALKACPHNSLVMAIKHSTYPIFGVQFHPEAILTSNGIKIFENFLKL